MRPDQGMKDLDRRLKSQLARFIRNDAEFESRTQPAYGNPWYGNLIVLGTGVLAVAYVILVIFGLLSFLSWISRGCRA